MSTKSKTRTPRPLNTKELAVLRGLSEGPATLEELAKRFRRAGDDALANSWVRNAMRRPRSRGLVKKVKRGTYTITDKGKAALDAPAKKAAA